MWHFHLFSFQKPSWEKTAKIIKERYFNFYRVCLIPRNYTLESLLCHLLCLIGNYLSISLLIWCLICTIAFLCRYDPEMDGRIILGRVDCTEDGDLCRRYPFSKNSISSTLFFPFSFLSCFFFHNLRELNSSKILDKGSLWLVPLPLTLDEWWLVLVPKLWFFLVGGLKTKGKRNYVWN